MSKATTTTARPEVLACVRHWHRHRQGQTHACVRDDHHQKCHPCGRMRMRMRMICGGEVRIVCIEFRIQRDNHLMNVASRQTHQTRRDLLVRAVWTLCNRCRRPPPPGMCRRRRRERIYHTEPVAVSGSRRIPYSTIVQRHVHFTWFLEMSA